MEKPKIYFTEQPPSEEEVRAYLSNYFDESILDYVFFVYRIKIEDGKCFMIIMTIIQTFIWILRVI